MGFMAYGRKLREDATVVTYAFGMSPGDPEAGVLVIPVDDPEAWHVEGSPGKPMSARRIAAKAVRIRETTGQWPENASFFS